MFIRFWSKESMINYVACQMDEFSNLGSGVPNTDDLNNVLRSFVDDPNNEVRTYSDSLYIPTENVENMLSQYPNNFSLFRIANLILSRHFLSISIKRVIISMLFVYKKLGYLQTVIHLYTICRGITSFIKAKYVVSTQG